MRAGTGKGKWARRGARLWLYAAAALGAAGALIVAGALPHGHGGAAAASRRAAVAKGQPVVHAAAAARTATAAHAAATARRATAARAAAEPAYVPAPRILTVGMHGPAVRSLQARLAALGYYPGRIDGRFGLDTLEAVWAFKEVQGLIINGANQDQVSHATERALVHPRLPAVQVPHGGGTRIEVSLRTETLVLYRHNRVALISHVSTGAGCLPGEGCGWDTPAGNYHAVGFANGWVQVPLGEMYNPVFFIGSVFAIHGEYDASVPWYPDSHGCVRIPFDIASFFHTLVTVPGTPVYIRG